MFFTQILLQKLHYNYIVKFDFEKYFTILARRSLHIGCSTEPQVLTIKKKMTNFTKLTVNFYLAEFLRQHNWQHNQNTTRIMMFSLEYNKVNVLQYSSITSTQPSNQTKLRILTLNGAFMGYVLTPWDKMVTFWLAVRPSS